jgi:signal transduction histidine kinase/cbb3-type cytochrome oxidase subunit 3
MFLRKIRRFFKLIKPLLWLKKHTWDKLQYLPVAVKVTAWYTIFLTLIFVLVVGFAFKFSENFRMQAAAAALQKEVTNAAKHPDKFDDHEDDVYLSIYDNRHIKLRGKLPNGLPPELPPQPSKGIQKFIQNNKEYWYYDVPVLQRNGDVSIMRGAMAMDKVNRRTDLILLGLLLGLPLFIIIAALGGYKIIKRGFQPVRTISATAQEIGETNDLSRRIDIGAGGDEIHQMASSFNTMLSRVETSVEREKRFSSDVSHELRTPVAVIMAESEYGRDCAASLEEAKEGFTSIHEQSKKMTILINQLLELARLGNTSTIAKASFDFSKLVQDTCHDYQILADAKKLTLNETIEPALTVNGNEALLQRILSNYLDNALKFSKTMITVTLQARQDKVLLCVADDGPGMEADTLKKIWERFYQTDASRNKKNNAGLGLGLATVRAIAKLHQGRAWAESTPGQGSQFYLEL